MASKIKVLVTGGTGLLGNALERAVKDWGSSPNDDSKVITLGGEVQWVPCDSTFVYMSSKDGDLRDKEAVWNIFEKHQPTHVVHLAARVGGLFANMNDQIGFLRDNLHMNDNVIMACQEFNVQRAVFCLSTCVYPAGCDLPYTEEVIHNGPPHPTNEGYAHAKRMLECLVRYHREKYGREWVCIIPTNLYGLNDNFNLEDSHVIPGLMHKCLLAERDKKPFVISGTGSSHRQFLCSIDAGRIILAFLRAPKARIDYSSVILCADGDQEYTIKEVAESIIRYMKFDGAITWDTSKSDGIAKKTATNARLRKIIGGSYKFTTLEEGLEETCLWFKSSFDTPNVVRK